MSTEPRLVLTLKDSYKLTKKEIKAAILAADFSKRNPELMTDKRSLFSLKMEWAVHKALFKLGIQKERTRTVDLDWPQPLSYRILYGVLGLLFWPFIK